METLRTTSWLATNQRCLVSEFARLKARLGPPGPGSNTPETRENTADTAGSTAIDELTAIFGLSAFERDLVLLCAGVEMDSELAARCAAATGNPDHNAATFGLGLAALENPHWNALTPSGPLRRWRLVEPEHGLQLTTSPLRIDERILHFLAGLNSLDIRLKPALRLLRPFPSIAEGHELLARKIRKSLSSGEKPDPVLLLSGDDPQGQEDVAIRVAGDLGLFLYGIQASDLPSALAELENFHVLWSREARLLSAALLIHCEPGPPPVQVLNLAEKSAGLLFIACREPFRLLRTMRIVQVNKPDPPEQKRLWRMALGASADTLNGTLDVLAGQFRMSAEAIGHAAAEIAEGLQGDEPPGEVIWNACRSLGRQRLDDHALRIESTAQWDDLIIPESEKGTLRQIAAQVKHRLTVHEDWGFSAKNSRGLGVSALFVGESGTGKTMAAEVLARELKLDLYRIDLSSVVSKYIGETEKNLKRVFDAAEDGGSALLFDEADALFGKRSEVKDSHDRYANIEVGYLLQRMEAYRGLAILTTNLRFALDKSFQRRLRFVVQFPFPDPHLREEIWKRIFPAAAPLEGLNYHTLAQANLTGGSIRNIALNAAFLAADDGSLIRMSHLLEAARSEARKIERPLTDSETRGWL